MVNGLSATRPASPPDADQVGEVLVRRVVTVLAVLVGGLCFLFSLGNVYQLAVDLELWVWIRPLVAPAVDLSIVALVVGIRFLARRGVTGRELRRPRLFMLAVGLAAWALNTAGAVAERDWGRAAFDSLAPGLLIGWAEVLPWFLRQFHTATHHPALADQRAPTQVAAPPAADGNGAVSPATAGRGQSTIVSAVPAGTPPGSGNGTRGAGAGAPQAHPGLSGEAGTSGTARPVPAAAPGGSGTAAPDADAAMRAWWAAERAAGRTPSGAELDRVCGRDPRNGSGRKARARYLREEAAGRFRTPQPAPTAAPAESGLVPDRRPAIVPGSGAPTPGIPATRPVPDLPESPPRG